MKKTLALALVSMSSVSFAFDYDLKLESRLDLVNKSTKTTENANSTKVNSNNFEGSTIRLNLQGKIKDDLTYRVRYRLNVADSSVGRDKTTKSLDYAYLEFKRNDFKYLFGKHKSAEAHGRESVFSGSNLFVKTDFSNLYNSNIGTFRIGLIGSYEFAEKNTIKLSVFNPNNVSNTSEDQQSLAYGVYYNGRLSKYFQPLASYEIIPQDEITSESQPKATSHVYALGFKSEIIENLVFDLDYKEFKNDLNNDNGDHEAIFSALEYRIENFAPFYQYTYDSSKSNQNSDKSKASRISVGIKYFPYNDVNLSLHSYYTNENKHELEGTSFSKVDAHIIGLGFRADI